MGGRGTSSGQRGQYVGITSIGGQTVTQQATQQAAPQQPPQQPTNMQQATSAAPPAPHQMTLQQFAGLSDDQMANVLKAAQGVDMPNHLKDAKDPTQELVYTIGLNDPPQVLDSQQFNQFMADNGIEQSEIMARSINGGTYTTTSGNQRRLSPQQLMQMYVSDPYNYIGGKHGGQALGAGAYFDKNGGQRTNYGSGGTMVAVLNPATARVISDMQVSRKWATWSRTHPKAAAEIIKMARTSSAWGSADTSLKALAMGYNVVHSSSYYNVIDRKALVFRQ